MVRVLPKWKDKGRDGDREELLTVRQLSVVLENRVLPQGFLCGTFPTWGNITSPVWD